MRREIIIFLISLQLIPSLTTAGQNPNHLQSAKRKYPYSLLGDDFGILDEQDLASNTCDAYPVPFSEKSMAFPYWQCFRTSTASFVCDDAGYDEDEKSQMAILAIDIHGQTEDHSYLSRRAIHASNCEYFRQKWKKLTGAQENVCIAGQFTEFDKTESKKREGIWTFDKFKTKKGCYSYFYDDCDLRYQMKHGCKVRQVNVAAAK
ncbi:MAG: hypothetical protein P4M08_05620 [Oligoflexia bacterium]|nr:hypothetical protein [Oligoflexia bacterium]